MRIFRKVGHVCTFTLISLPIDFPLNRKNQFGGRGEGKGGNCDCIKFPILDLHTLKSRTIVLGSKLTKGRDP